MTTLFKWTVDTSDDESGMAKDIIFKPRVEATKQMTQNWTFRGPRISDSAKIASKWHVCSSYFMFPFYLTPENLAKLRELIWEVALI